MEICYIKGTNTERLYIGRRRRQKKEGANIRQSRRLFDSLPIPSYIGRGKKKTGPGSLE